MQNQMNFVFNHSDKLEALGTQYYELLFKTGVIANRMTENHAQGLKAGEKGAGVYLASDSMEARIVQTLAEENVMRRLATLWECCFKRSPSNSPWKGEQYDASLYAISRIYGGPGGSR